MAGQVSYNSLYTLVQKQINNALGFNTATPTGNQINVATSAPQSNSSSVVGDASTSQLMSAIQQLLTQALPQRIISGLYVTATDPISNVVNIAPGSGTVGGIVYELSLPVVVAIPFDAVNNVFYINLVNNAVKINTTGFVGNELTLAKITVPQPGISYLVSDQNSNDGVTAWINQYQEFTLHANQYGKLEEDSLEFFRDNIGQILANNLIGNIELSENLTLTNTAGTLYLNSNSLQLFDSNADLLATFNQQGIYFYNTAGVEMARFTNVDARIGNIVITTNSIQSQNYVAGISGFSIQDSGNVEFSNGIFRGTLYAASGVIGGFTITPTQLYGGTIQTSLNVGIGLSGVIMSAAGLFGYDAILGQTFSLPTNGSAPTFASGIINSTIFNINTSSVIRTSNTVGDGTANSAGVLINNTGFYACQASQLLNNANVKILANGNAFFSGTISATAGIIGGVTINPTSLVGGLIVGSEIQSAIIETSVSYPRVRIDSFGVSYQVTTAVGQYNNFKYGDGTKYGTGVLAYLFNSSYPVLSIMASTALADIRLYNRGVIPSGASQVGDLACVNGTLQICTVAGTPGTYTSIGSGTVTTLSVASANGFAGTVATATTTPAITLSTTITGILKGNGTAISAASAGTDYAPATSGSSILKGNGSGGFSAASSGTDYAPATSGTSILYGNNAGGFSSVTVGTGLSFLTGTLSNTVTSAPSNLLFHYSGSIGAYNPGANGGEYRGTNLNPNQGQSDSYYRYFKVNGAATYQEMWECYFIKITGVSTVTVYTRLWCWDSAHPPLFKLAIGTLSGTVTGTTASTPAWSSFTIDVSSLTNGVAYLVVASMYSTNAEQCYCSDIQGFGS